MNKITLTVIIPNYNKSNYIRKCLESVLNQTYKPLEIIVVDDKSTDNSKEVVLQIAKNNPIIKPIFLEKNGGVSNARNVGLNAAKGNYVTFIDSDDYYFNNHKLENEISLITASKVENPVAYSRIILVDQDGDEIATPYNSKFKKSDFITGRDFPFMLSLFKKNRVPRDYCVSKEFITKVGAYSFYKNYFEDLDLLMRLAVNKANFLCTYESGTAYRQLPGGLSKRTKKDSENTIKEICQQYVGLLTLQEKGRYKHLRRRAFLSKITNDIVGFYKRCLHKLIVVFR